MLQKKLISNKKFRKTKWIVFTILFVSTIIYGTIYFLISESFIRTKIIPKIQTDNQIQINIAKIQIEYFFIPKIKFIDVDINKKLQNNQLYAKFKQINIRPQIIKWMFGDFQALDIDAIDGKIILTKDQQKINLQNSNLQNSNFQNINFNAKIALEQKNQVFQIKGNLKAYKQKISFDIHIKQNQKQKIEVKAKLKTNFNKKNLKTEKIDNSENFLSKNIDIETLLNIDIKQKILNITKIKAIIGEVIVDANIKWQQKKINQINANININKLYLDEFIENIKAFMPEKIEKQSENLKKDAQKIQKTNLDIEIYVGLINNNKKDIIGKLHANIKATLHNQQINNYQIKINKAKTYQGYLTADISKKNENANNIVKIKAQNINIEKLTKNTKYENIVTGNVDADINLNFPSDNLTQIIQNVRGDIVYQIKDGYIIHKITQTLLKQIRNIAKKISVAGPPGNNIKFKYIKGTVQIGKNFTTIRADIQNNIININAKGKINRKTKNFQFDNQANIWPDENGNTKWKFPFKMNGNTQNLQNLKIIVNNSQLINNELTQTKKKLQKIQNLYKNKIKNFSIKK